MRYRMLPAVIVVMLVLLSGCGNSGQENDVTNGGNSSPVNEGQPVPNTGPFEFNRDDVAKVTVYLGSDRLLAEVTDAPRLQSLEGILDGSPPHVGAAQADWPYTIVIETREGAERELTVTGNGYVFIDQTTKIAYELDKDRFEEFVRPALNAIHNPTAEEMLRNDPDADIFQWNDVIYSNAEAIEWVQDADIAPGEKLGTIAKSHREGMPFEDQMATKLPEGAEVFESNPKAGPVLIVKTDGKELRYLGLIEG